MEHFLKKRRGWGQEKRKEDGDWWTPSFYCGNEKNGRWDLEKWGMGKKCKWGMRDPKTVPSVLFLWTSPDHIWADHIGARLNELIGKDQSCVVKPRAEHPMTF